MRKLMAGEPARLFATTDITGAPIRLEDYRGHYTLLTFLRSAACRLCSLRVHYLIEHYPALRARGLEIVAIFETSPATTVRYVGSQHPPFPLIVNPQHDLYRLYGVERSFWGFITGFLFTRRRDFRRAVRMKLGKLSDGNHLQLPADFLIAPDLTIARAYYGRDIGDHLPLSAIDAYLGEQVHAGAR